MRKTAILWLIILCASAAFGQSAPQWRVVQSFFLTSQTAAIPTTTLVTPPKAGVYRLTGYMSGRGGTGGGNWVLSFTWTDLAGHLSNVQTLTVLTGKANWTQM